jgi:TIR domain
MAYIPRLNHDLFISYAHEDADWVSALQEQLSERLTDRLGCDADVWQDINKLRTGQDFSVELEKAVRASAALIAVLSRNYQGSRYCEKELDAFLDEAEKRGDLETGGYRRVLKVIKLPWRDDAHTGFLESYQHVECFDRDPKTGKVREFKQTSERFRNAADTLSYHVEELFNAILRGMVKVFVARVPEDSADDRESVIREIRASGYALSPHPTGAVPKALDRKTVRKYIDDSHIAVHLLGPSADLGIRDQIDLALEAEKKMIFYLLRGHESATGDQKRLIEDVRENKMNLPRGRWALLESRSTDLKQALIELLAPPRPSAATPESLSRVYLLCDPNTPEDAVFARQVQAEIQNQERISVELPAAAADSHSPVAQHERLLRECDGLLLYHDKAPPKWVKRSFADLLTAEDLPRPRPLISKAELVAAPAIRDPSLELTVIQRGDQFELRQLESFLAPLRTQGGAANAG